MKTRHVFGYIKDVPAEAAQSDHDVEFVCSTDVIDRSDEIIDQGSWQLGNFAKNPVFLAAHMHRLSDGRSPVIGSFTAVNVAAAAEGQQLVGRVKFADTELGREYRSLYRDKHMRAVSVGFMPGDHEERKTEDGRRILVWTDCELYEVSAVAVPCNQEALVRMRAAGLVDLDADDDPADPAADLPETVQDALRNLQTAIDARFDELSEQITLLTDDVNEREAPTENGSGGDAELGDDRDGNDDGAGKADESDELTQARQTLLAATQPCFAKATQG